MHFPPRLHDVRIIFFHLRNINFFYRETCFGRRNILEFLTPNRGYCSRYNSRNDVDELFFARNIRYKRSFIWCELNEKSTQKRRQSSLNFLFECDKLIFLPKIPEVNCYYLKKMSVGSSSKCHFLLSLCTCDFSGNEFLYYNLD